MIYYNAGKNLISDNDIKAPSQNSQIGDTIGDNRLSGTYAVMNSRANKWVDENECLQD